MATHGDPVVLTKAHAVVDANTQVQSLSSRRAATHWLFSHVAGARGVWIPDTALFDGEGVLVAWLSTHSPQTTNKTKTRKKVQHDAKDLSESVEIRNCDFMELSLLRFEARLQDLVAKSAAVASVAGSSETVAVLYSEATALELDEAALDTTIRSLCARERNMTASEPDLLVPRGYPGGCFVLQAAVQLPRKVMKMVPLAAQAADVPVVVTTRVDARSGSLSHELQNPQKRKRRDEDQERGDSEEDAADQARDHALRQRLSFSVPRIEKQCRALLSHLEAVAGLRVQTMTLEFVGVGRDHVVLTCAHSIEWLESPHNSSRERSNVKSHESQSRSRSKGGGSSRHSHHFRVCRECRAPVEVDLARELLQSQTLLRGALAKYQEMSERQEDAEKRCGHAINQSLHLYTQIQAVETEVGRLRAQLAQQETKTKEETQQKLRVESELEHSIEQTQKAQQDVAQAQERIQELETLRGEHIQSVESEACSKIRELETQELTHTRQLQQARQEINELQAKNRKLQALYEEAQASSDEMKFQWGFVTRKLTDVGDSGVLPPKRVAGGFSSYPTPTQPNVEQVVKWIVDYETKRTLLEAQQHKSRHDKTVRKRLRMKMELMRLLAASGASSPSRSPSPSRRRSSRSPRKRPSLSPKKEPSATQRSSVRWAEEHPTLVEQRVREAASVMAAPMFPR